MSPQDELQEVGEVKGSLGLSTQTPASNPNQQKVNKWNDDRQHIHNIRDVF